MADERDPGRRRSSGSSIFSDDDDERGARDWNPERKGWGPRADRGGGGEGGGFFDRARDEVRSWFGDEDGQRGRGGQGWSERSSYGRGQSGFGGETYRSNRSGGGDHGGEAGSYFRREQSGTSHFDENYRRWRDQEIAKLDREYEEYCRERQQRFESDFHGWRESRRGKASESTAGGDGDASATHSSTGSSPERGATNEEQGDV